MLTAYNITSLVLQLCAQHLSAAWALVLMPLVCCQQENQDKFLLQLNRDDGWSVMGVFDGHGMWGGKVASIVRDSMLKALKDVDGRKMNGSDPEMVHLLS